MYHLRSREVKSQLVVSYWASPIWEPRSSESGLKRMRWKARSSLSDVLYFTTLTAVACISHPQQQHRVVVRSTESRPKLSSDQRQGTVPGAGDSEVNEADKVPVAAMGQSSASRRQMLTKHCRSRISEKDNRGAQLKSDCQRGCRGKSL